MSPQAASSPSVGPSHQWMGVWRSTLELLIPMIEFVRQARMPGILTLPATCVASEHSAGWFAIIPSAGWSFFCLTALRVGGARGERRTDSSRGRHFPATPIPWRECSAGAGVMNRPLQHAGTTRWRSTAEQWRDPKICTFLRGSVLKIFSERRMVPIIALDTM